MRFKLIVTKVEIAEVWVRAVDEESAIVKVQEELTASWAYAGRWETKATDVQVIDSQGDLGALDPGDSVQAGPMLLKLKDAASELGISYGTLHALLKEGGIEYTQVGATAQWKSHSVLRSGSGVRIPQRARSCRYFQSTFKCWLNRPEPPRVAGPNQCRHGR